MDSAGDVPDSTDWLGTPLAGLMPVEQAFRCHVCKDFYNSPMITSCNHTFCSLCIRRCLSVEGKCPLCRATDQESKLRGNWALREAVDAFCKARVAVLAVARTPPAIANARPSSPKRKTTGDEEHEDGPETKRPRTSARLSKAKAVEATAAIMQEEADQDIPESRNDGMEYEPDDGLAACPICWARMKLQHVDKHIDTSCPGSPQPTSNPGGSRSQTANSQAAAPPQPQQPASNPPERLPSISYSLLNDAALRKKMSQLGISTSGPRQLLEGRHKEWVTIWNANCDSARPKRRAELLHELDVWERTLGGRAPTSSRSASLGAQIKDKDFDGAAWAARHESSFKDLIANARKTRLKASSSSSSSASKGNNGHAAAAAAAGSEVVPESSPREGPAVPRRMIAVVDLSNEKDVVPQEPPDGMIIGHVTKRDGKEESQALASGHAVVEKDALHVLKEARDVRSGSAAGVEGMPS